MKYFIGFMGGMVIAVFNFVWFICGVTAGHALFGWTPDKVRRYNPGSDTAYRVNYSSYNGKEN